MMNVAGFCKHVSDVVVSALGFGARERDASLSMRTRTVSSRFVVPLSAGALAILTAICAPLTFPAQADRTVEGTVPPSVEARLNTHIKRYIDWYEAKHCGSNPLSTCRGTEYPDARTFCFGDIDGDDKEDIAVLYEIESFCCGNNDQVYLAVFLRKGSKFELAASEKVGGQGERGVHFDTIEDGKILLKTDEYLPDEPMCCPSGKGTTAYSLKDGKLVESGRTGERPGSP